MKEPSAKRPRSATEVTQESHNDQSYRYIKLNMEKYDEWVHKLSDDELVRMFELGVIVKKSVVFTADDKQNYMKDEIRQSEKRITEVLGEHKRQLDAISTSLANPSKKGARAEKDVLDILNQHLRSSGFTFTFIKTTSEKGKGDIEAESPEGHKIMIEVKDHAKSVSKGVIESFEDNLAKSPDFKVGILLSMRSSIAMRSKGSTFEVAFSQEERQHQIYVPNAYVNKEDHLILWSVVMAAELAKIEGGELGERKTQKLQKIYQEFQKNVQHSKNCRASLTTLETSIQNLKDNIVPILNTVDKTKNDIYKLLHSSYQ